ncbi:hypothetical protein [Sphaerotilus montanus]|uniref:hypothetical protein n=1 Tax=Sphaerotilus montanus TaxID=522889 RepID=UPI003FA1C8D7
MKSEDQIKALEVLNGVTGVEKIKENFYYDETNNYRKVHFHEGRLNITDNGDFFLGGISLIKSEIDIEKIRKLTRIDKTASEIKFKNVASGDALSILNSKRLRIIFEELLECGAYVHFSRVDVLFWSIIDIIESVDYNFVPKDELIYHLHVKSRLYEILTADVKYCLKFFQKYNYPDISSENISNFYDELLSMVRWRTDYQYVDYLLLIFLTAGKKSKEATFIQNEDRLVLINDFTGFYRERTMSMPNSMHIFDNEHLARDSLSNFPSTYNGSPICNYKFMDSKLSPEIQISDVTIGLYARLINFCKRKSINEIKDIRKCLNGNQLSLLKIARDLVDRSDDYSRVLFNSIVPVQDQGKWAALVY